MPERATAGADRSPRSGEADGAARNAGPRGIQGWLLVLCLMLTVVGPAISIWLMVNEYTTFSARFARSGGLQLAILASLGLAACSTAFGIYAGSRLWAIRPGAVALARKALLFGLAVDIVTTAIDIAAAPAPSPHVGFVNDVLLHVAPSLVFFTACLGYLNRSARVAATYCRDGAEA